MQTLQRSKDIVVYVQLSRWFWLIQHLLKVFHSPGFIFWFCKEHPLTLLSMAHICCCSPHLSAVSIHFTAFLLTAVCALLQLQSIQLFLPC